MLIAVFKNNFIVLFIIIFRTLSLPIVCFIELLLLKHRFCHFWQCPHSMRSRVCALVRWTGRWTVLSGNWQTVRENSPLLNSSLGQRQCLFNSFGHFFLWSHFWTFCSDDYGYSVDNTVESILTRDPLVFVPGRRSFEVYVTLLQIRSLTS